MKPTEILDQLDHGAGHKNIVNMDAQRQEKELAQNYLDIAQVILVAIDKQARITLLNQKGHQVLGYKNGELIGKDWFRMCLPQDEYEIVKNVFDKIISGNIELHEHYENKVQTKSGQTRIISWHNTLLHDESGRVIGTLSSGEDITERKNIQQALTESLRKLEEKELSKSRFFAAAGHDLRQPLAAANMFLDSLKLTELTPTQDKIIQQLDSALSIFKNLLDSLLNISKLDSGVIKPELIPINVTDIFNWLKQSFAHMAINKQIGFNLYFPMKETLVVLGDNGLFRSVLMNLVSNAIRFTSKGAVLVSARKRRNEVLFQVWDTGIGISDEHINRIFDEFYQVGNQQRDRTAGLGLGLAIAKRAATLLDSKITCRSQVGRGSVFEFRLPLDSVLKGKIQQTFIDDASKKNMPGLSFVRGKRFVVLEDDMLVMQALTQTLEGLGGEVEYFHSAEEALHHTNIRYADCYIVDYMLSGTLSGIDFLNLIRQKLSEPICGVLITGDTSTNLIQKASDFEWPILFKPVNMIDLISTLEGQKSKHI